MPNASYPLDTTGISPANKVVGEPHALTEINSRTYRILIPDFAPFYLDNFRLVHRDTLGVETVLVRDVDFTFTLPYLGASRSIKKMLYGGVAINKQLLNGSIRMDYQTLGGPYVADIQFVREQLYEVVYNPRFTSWDVIANKPEQFPPVNHTQDIDTIYGADELIEAIEDVAEAILTGPNPSNDVVHHFVDENNPHKTTKAQVQLGLVENLPVATDLEVQNRDPASKYLLLRQALTLFQSYNPGVTKESIGLGLVKNYDTATDAEVANKTPAEKYTLLKHVVSLVNQINKAYVGLPVVQNYDTATDTEVTNKTPANKYILLRQVLTLLSTINKGYVGLPDVENLPVALDAELAAGTGRKYVVLPQVRSMITGYTPPLATDATKLQTARSISMTGDGTWTVNFNGSGNVTSGLTLANTITAGEYVVATYDSKGRATSGRALVATDIPSLPGSKITSAISVDTSGNAGTATKLQTSRTISTTGDASWSVNFDGSANATAALTLANTITAGEYVVTTHDAKGRATGGRALVASDVPSLPGSKINSDITVNTSGNAATATKLATARTINGVNFDGTGNITINAVDSTARIASSEKGAANGVATLDGTGKIPAGQLPSYVDDVVEAATFSGLPATGETGKIYVVIDSGFIYRWSGSIYIQITTGTGTVDSATKLSTPRNISITGDGTWTVSFDGSNNVSAALTLANTIAAGEYVVTTHDAKGRAVSGRALVAADIPSIPGSKLNSDISVNTTGNAATATKLATVRSIAVSGDASWSVNFDGSANVTAALTLANVLTAGEYVVATYDAKGRATSGRALAATDVPSLPGTKINSDITVNTSGNAATATKLATARSIAMSGDGAWSVNFDGSGNATASMTLANSGVTAGTYPKVTVDAKGRVTGGTNLSSADVTTGLNYTPVNKAGDKMNGQLSYATPVSVASAPSMDVSALTSNVVTLTGTAAITTFGNVASGVTMKFIFAAAASIVYNASTMQLPGNTNITAEAGDTAEFISLGGGAWKCFQYTRVAGSSLTTSTSSVSATQYYLMGG